MTNIDDTHLEMFNKVFIEKIDLVQDSEETELFNLAKRHCPIVWLGFCRLLKFPAPRHVVISLAALVIRRR